MNYHALSECTLSPAERLEEAGRIINMLTASTETYFKLSLKELQFIDGMQSSCSVAQLFWLRDIKDRVLQCH
jgi:hypothetical protein